MFLPHSTLREQTQTAYLWEMRLLAELGRREEATLLPRWKSPERIR